MSIYSGSSPFARGKLGGNKIAGIRSFGAKLSRGKGKRIFKAFARIRNSNRDARTATVSSKGFAAGQIQGGTSSRLRKLQGRGVTSTVGLAAYDGLGLHSATGGHAYVIAFCGTDYAHAEEAVGSLKNVKITLTHVDASTSVRTEHTGFLGTVGSFGRVYYIEFPTRTTAFAINDELSITLEFTT